MSHFYSDGKNGVYPSVTTILHDILPDADDLKRWKKNNKNHASETEFKSKIGTITHYRILKQFCPTLPLPDLRHSEYPKTSAHLTSIAESMFNKLGIKLAHPVFVEHTVLSHKYKYAGKLDLVGRIDFPMVDEHGTDYQGKLGLFDIKTGNYIRDEYTLQLAGYGEAFDYKGLKPDIYAIINVHPFIEKNPTLEARITPFTKNKIMTALETFLPLVNEYHSRHPEACTLKGMKALGGSIE